MYEEIAIGGFGGQGVLFIGRLLAESAMLEGFEIAYVPSYGAEKRGGTSKCAIIISDQPIGSLVSTHPTISIAMNETSIAEFSQSTCPSGAFFYIDTTGTNGISRNGVDVIPIPAIDLAIQAGNASAANLVLLGAMLAIRPIISTASLMHIMRDTMKVNERRLDTNQQALHLGRDYALRCSQVRTAE